MKRTIKSRMIINGILTVMVSIILAMVIVFYLLKNQNQVAAEKRIDEAVVVVEDQYKKVEQKLLASAEKIATNMFVSEQFSFIEETIEVNQSIEFILLQICDYIFEQAQVNSLSSVRIYDNQGKWINGVIISGDTGKIMFPDLPGSEKYKENMVPVGELAKSQNWKVKTASLTMPARLPLPVLSKKSTIYQMRDKKLSIEIGYPIFDSYEKTIQVGVLYVSSTIQQAFVDRVADFTGTAVNLFLGTDLSVGSLDAYNLLALGKEGQLFEKGNRLGADISQKITREIDLGGHKYFEGVFPIIVQDGVLGAFSVLLSQDETRRNLNQMMFYLLLIAVACLLGVTPLTLVFANSIIKPIKQVVAGIRDIAEGEGDLTVRLQIHSEDEVGELARWFNTFTDKLQKLIRDISENSDILNSSSSELAGLSGQMAENAYRMLSRAQTVNGMSAEMTGNMAIVATTMDESSTNMTTIASSAEELSAVLSEVSSNSERARAVTEEAVTQSRNASSRVEELGVAATQIGNVIETITEISEQTNLLALNATIESARAGEAGKGFAVVANEIKALAQQTAEATLEIKQQIEDIQQTSSGTTNDIKKISNVIMDVSEIVTNIAASVEEQSISTREIAQNVAQASGGISDVNENIARNSSISDNINQYITRVSEAANDISLSSDQVDRNAKDLSSLADTLKKLVDLFKV